MKTEKNKTEIKREIIHSFKLNQNTEVKIMDPIGYDSVKLCSYSGNLESAIGYLLESLVLINGESKSVDYFEKLSFTETTEIIECISKFIEKPLI